MLNPPKITAHIIISRPLRVRVKRYIVLAYPISKQKLLHRIELGIVRLRYSKWRKSTHQSVDDAV